ncbi:zinc finger protein 665 [Biomphalaria glabrata]|nr:zinc finger protein 665-like [Biomphalaria glabrata]
MDFEMENVSSESNSQDDFNDYCDYEGKSSSEKQPDENSLQSEKKRNYKREKGPPIICLTCKKVWTKNCKGGRLFMFGGSRPFMAKFEAKCIALMGKEALTALQNKSATKFGRSYICRECYLVLRQTYDNVRKIQRDVARSIQRMRSPSGPIRESITESDNSGSDQDLEMDCLAQVHNKKKLPPVAERIAEKIASLTLVKINNKTPRICLKPITAKSAEHKNEAVSQSNSEFVNTFQSNCTDSDLKKKTAQEKDSELKLTVLNREMCLKSVSLTDVDHSLQSKSQDINKNNDCNISTSVTLTESLSSDSCSNLSNVNPQNELDSKVRFQQNQDLEESTDKEYPTNKPSQVDLAEILANPLLLIKTPQPIKLADIKNKQVYVCGEGNCDWIFSSRFYWENHVRHYHRSGRPFICPFEGCGRSFAGRSKLELHIRSHTDERPFICDKCGNGFRGNQELKAHRLTHTTEKPHQCLKCDKTFKLLSSLKRHLQFHDGGNFPFPCTYPECEKAFKNKYDLKCHNRLHTGEKPYKCKEPGCGMAFRIPCQFTMHKRSHTGERPFRCNIDGCSAAYISSNALQAHMVSHTTERPFCCEFCGKTFKHKMLHRIHLKKHSGLQNFLCPVEGCSENLNDRKSLNQHMASQHGMEDYKSAPKKVFQCTEEGCGLVYSTDGGLRYHKLRVHNKGSKVLEEDHRQMSCPYDKCARVYEDAISLHDHLIKAHMPIPREKMCPCCGQAYPLKDQLELHINSAHNGSPTVNGQTKGFHVCHSERCGLRFHKPEELTHHVTWHLGNPPYRCEYDECNRTFLLETMLNQHMTEHENQKNFTCSFDSCSEGFTTNLKVLKHSKFHYGFFRCPIDGCNKAMQTLGTARMHLLRHEKPFVCFVCAKRFALHHQWSKHKRSHTGEKVFECKICCSQFLDPASLKSHKQSHKGEKQFICEECGQQLASLTLYKTHIRTHSTELPYVCSEENCKKDFRDIVSLKAHQNTHLKPSHLCTQCGKVYKFSVSKHKCKIDFTESKTSYLQQIKQEVLSVQPLQSTIPPIANQNSVHQPPQLQLSDSVASMTTQSSAQTLSLPLTLQQLPSVQTVPPQQPHPQQFNMNNLALMPENHPQSYTMEVEEAARAMRQNFNAPETVVLQDTSHYNYIILYDRPAQQ